MSLPKSYSTAEIREILRNLREENERRSCDVVDLWNNLSKRINDLGDEKLLILEQVCIAALDCNRIDVSDQCLKILSKEFPTSLRVRKLNALKFEALENFDEALNLLKTIIPRDQTNAAPKKRLIAILKARGKISEAIKELVNYLATYMSDQEGWQELCDLYLMEQDHAKASFCMEELILHNPHNHLIHQRYAEIRYSMGGLDNFEIARSHYCLAIKLNPNNLRALFGLYMSIINIGYFPRFNSPKKQEANNKLLIYAQKEIEEQYKQHQKENDQLPILGIMFSSLRLNE